MMCGEYIIAHREHGILNALVNLRKTDSKEWEAILTWTQHN